MPQYHMKKSTNKNNLSDIIFKILLTISIIVVSIIIFNSPLSNFSVEDKSPKKMKVIKDKNKSSQKDFPSQLKWHDSFKGINNENKRKNGENGDMKLDYFKK